MTKLTTHVLDVYSGKPGKNIKVDIYYVSKNRIKLNSVVLNNDGRSEKSLVKEDELKNLSAYTDFVDTLDLEDLGK